jgi:hypothetical protein
MAELSLWFDRQGRPISSEECMVLFSRDEYRQVAHTDLGDKGNISTVWLGIDHGFGMGQQPVIFETMVFGGPHTDWQERYRTEAEALAGHARIVKMCGGDPDSGEPPKNNNRIVEV